MKRSEFFNILQIDNNSPKIILELAGAFWMNMYLSFNDNTPSEIIAIWYKYLASKLS